MEPTCEEPTCEESTCVESTCVEPCQICAARKNISDLKDAIERKLSLAQFLLDIVNKCLGEVKELTKPEEC